jgi:Tfp pilus assembly protein PilF
VCKRLSVFVVLCAAELAWARDKQESWIEVTSPHLSVYSDGSEKQARQILDQFERMRLVFQAEFPNMHMELASPIAVIAVKDEKDFRALEPEAYLAKGQLQLGGLFLRAPDKNYVLLRMDIGGEHPYAAVYHEYTHLLISKAGDWFPLWLDEGLAEFYQNTDIHEKDTMLGKPSQDDILWLRQNRLLPLTTLFAVDRTSPYYHEEKKGSIFYAESWALTHYLQVQDFKNNTTKIDDYVKLVGHDIDPVAAAAQAFGDLKQLQSALDGYVGGLTFYAFRLKKELPVNDAVIKVQPIPLTQADAVRADFLAYNQREKDARVLLDQVLHDDPSNTLAHETMGMLELHAGHLDEAEKWYGQAVKLDSQSYLANYYFALTAMNRGNADADTDAQIEASLRKAIKLNPAFAGSYERLAVFYGMHRKNLDEAHMLILQAVELEPDNFNFRLNTANLLLAMQREDDAIAVLKAALKLAKTPAQVNVVQNAMTVVEQSQTAHKQEAESAQRLHESVEAYNKQQIAAIQTTPPQPKQESLKGPHRTITGTIKNVRCAAPAVMDLDLTADGRTITLHAGNYYEIRFSALGFMPKGDLQPCAELEGMSAKVEYIDSTTPKINGLISVEMHK